MAQHDPEADSLRSPGQGREGQGGKEIGRQQQNPEAIVDLLQHVCQRAHPRQALGRGQEPVSRPLPGEQDGECGGQGETAGRDPAPAHQHPGSDCSQQKHSENVAEALGQNHRHRTPGFAAAELARQPGLAQLARLAGRDREQEADQKDPQAVAPTQAHLRSAEVALPAQEAEAVVEE